MLTKKQLWIVLSSAIVLFCMIVLFSYTVYIHSNPKNIEPNPIIYGHTVQDLMEEKQVVMAQAVAKIQSSTNVVFEIVDQFGLIVQTDMYPGIHWRNYTEVQMKQLFPDYTITLFTQDQVALTRVVERQIQPNYIVTKQKDDVIIAIERNGHQIFYRQTGLHPNDLSSNVNKMLDQGIAITPEQKDAILKDPDELYIILQEHDE